MSHPDHSNLNVGAPEMGTDLRKTPGSFGWTSPADPNTYHAVMRERAKDDPHPDLTENSGCSAVALAATIVMACIAICAVMGTVKLALVLFT